MSPATDTLAEVIGLLAIESCGEGSFRAGHTELARTSGHVFGGLVAAQATVAACRTVAAERRIHSLHAYFLRPGNPQLPIRLEVDRTRDGGSFSHRRVSAIQDGGTIMEMACSFAAAESGLSHQVRMPDVPPADQLRPDWEELRLLPGTHESVTAPGAFDLRSAEPHSRISRDRGERTDRSRMWMRTQGQALPDDPELHTALLVYASDMTVLDPATRPAGLSIAAGDVLPATIDHALWFHAPLRCDEWFLCDADSPWAGSGRGYTRARIFDASGVLAAEVAQEGLIRLPRG